MAITIDLFCTWALFRLALTGSWGPLTVHYH
jgi:hypothetical protein